MSKNNISFILHKPQLSENIGACARAIKNFSFKKLILINPKPIFPNDKVFATSVGAKNIINQSKVYENIEKALKDIDIVIIDTAGRLQNKKDLMEELTKTCRVVSKLDHDAPHQKVVVLDGTVGQNAHSQLKSFDESIGLTGMIITKLDGSAKGGVVVSLAEKFEIPIHAVGVGEGLDDLQIFEASSFSKALAGLD